MSLGAFLLTLLSLGGRQTTELMLALLTGSTIYAGSLSRTAAALVLRAGCPALLMPLALGLAACPAALILLRLVERAPRPSAADVETRSRRAAMSGAQRVAFLRAWSGGLMPLCVVYALLTALRTVRDLYSQQLFAQAMHVAAVPSWVYLLADLPGALSACGLLVWIAQIRGHRCGTTLPTHLPPLTLPMDHSILHALAAAQICA